MLVVEDNVFFREVFTENFKERFPDLIVEVAATGDEALQKATEHPPDLMVLDIELGGINGLDVGRRIRSAFPGIKIAMFTSYDLPEYRQAAKGFGADWFLVKDAFQWQDVEEVIESICR